MLLAPGHPANQRGTGWAEQSRYGARSAREPPSRTYRPRASAPSRAVPTETVRSMPRRRVSPSNAAETPAMLSKPPTAVTGAPMTDEAAGGAGVLAPCRAAHAAACAVQGRAARAAVLGVDAPRHDKHRGMQGSWREQTHRHPDPCPTSPPE